MTKTQLPSNKLSPVVTIAIVSYNTRVETVKSIQSVFNSTGFSPAELEVILVDNNSPDDTVSYVKSHFPQVKVMANKVNKGFGGGNNQAAKVAKGKYLLLLNPDAFLAKDSLKHLVGILSKRPDVLSVGPQLRYGDGRLQLSGGYLPTPGRVLAWMWWLDKLPLIKKLIPTPYHVIDPIWHTKPQYPEWLMGACIMFRTKEFLASGGFDEKIFMYAEEVELYRRLKESLAKKVYFTPATKVVHLGGVSTKKANAYRLALELKGIEYIYQKHYPRLFWFIKFVIITGVVMRVGIFSLIPSRKDSVPEYLNYFGK